MAMVRKAIHEDVVQAAQVLEEVKIHMLNEGIDQWDEEYPNIKVLAKYTKKEYEFVGTVHFRKGIFNCYEKAVK